MMVIFVSLLTLILPLFMIWSIKRSFLWDILFNILAIVSLYLFSVTTALAVLQTIFDQTVYLTTIHSILLNPLFLIPGGYLGMFALYRLLRLTWTEGLHRYSK